MGGAVLSSPSVSDTVAHTVTSVGPYAFSIRRPHAPVPHQVLVTGFPCHHKD